MVSLFQVEALHIEQANTDFYILCELLKDYIGLLGAVRDAFHERTKLFQHWQHSQQMLAKKREAKAKFGLQNRTDKADQASTEVVEVNNCNIRHIYVIYNPFGKGKSHATLHSLLSTQ